MKETDPDTNWSKLRMLVVIACYGEKNLDLLKRLILRYQSFSISVDVVVVSEAPKTLGPNVKVEVGLPTPNPWSLPFAHKQVMARSVDQYDLFAYSEDDMDVTEENVQAFLRATPHLAPDEIAGFIRYEIGRSGTWSLPEAHGGYHWKPETSARRGNYTVAEFSGEHAAFFLLTREQLKKAIASGGFLRAPYEGRYDLACTAATDPYICCGFRKVICISHFREFLIHHASNRYVGQLGITLGACEEQIQTLTAIADGRHPASTLCSTESGLLHGKWSKSYYEKPGQELLELVPEQARRVLSIGCGSGALEVELAKRGAKVTALPLNSVIGATAARQGIEVIHGTLAEGLKMVEERKFDCVVMTNLLHLLANPKQVLRQSARLVADGGVFVLGGPNFNSLRLLAKRALGSGDYRKLRAFDEGGINVLGPGVVAGALKDSGFRSTTVRWSGGSAGQGGMPGPLRSLKAEGWVLQARK